MNEIKLDSLYRRNNKLVHWKNSLWILKPEYNLCIRQGITSDGNGFIDPEAGPMIIENKMLNSLDGKEHLVKSIKFIKSTGFVIELE